MKKRIISAALAVCMLFGSAALLPESFSDSPSIMSASAEQSGNLKYSIQSDGTIAITGLVTRTETVEIPDYINGKKVTTIANSAFAALKPNKVTTKLTLPETLVNIEQYAFMNMQALTSITIPASVKTIGLGAFCYCNALQSVTFKGSLSSLGSGVFSGCSALTKIDIPSGVPTIDGNLFANCTSLKTITLPASATTIVPEAFNGCTALQSITVASGNSNYSSEDGVLYNKNKTSIICCPSAKTSLTIPGSVRTISDEFMFRSSSLTTLVLKEGITSIGDSAFAFCKKLTSVSLPSTLSSIGNYAFNTCTSLSEITVPASVTFIGKTALGFYRDSEGGTDKKQSNFKIKGYENSTAQSWAKSNGVTFVVIGQSCSHTYGSPTWSWKSDYSSATATAVCSKCQNKLTVDASITSATTAATCTKQGKTTYTAKAVINGTTYTDKREKTLPVDSSAHKWKSPAYTWSTDNKTCTARRECSENPTQHYETETSTATVTGTTAATCTAKGTTTYTATFKNSVFKTQTKKVSDIPELGHNYGDPAWSWTKTSSGYTCKATFTCTRCKTTSSVNATVTVATTSATCEKGGTAVYTAKAAINGKTYTATKTDTVAATGHNYGDPTWSWTKTSSGYTCKATFTCTKCKTSSSVNATVTVAATAATCEKGGTAVYTAKATFNGKTYTATKTETIAIDSNAHKWNSPSYSWSSDHKTCTAQRVCAYNSSHKQTENGTVTTKVKTAATCTTKGTTTYTAAFKNSAFKTQTAEAQDIAALGHNWGKPTYSWTKTSTGYTCTATRACTRNSSHKETETVTASYKVTKAPTTTAVGEGTYTASFSNTAFAKQTKTVEIPKETVKWNKPTYSWKQNGSDYLCTATRTASDSSGKKETETVTAKYQLTKAPTCTKAGEAEYIAAFKNTAFESQSKIVYPAAKGHSYDSYRTSKFNVDNGTAVRIETCSVCGSQRTTTVQNAVQRLSGSGRYATAASISGGAFTKAATVVLANGTKFADALAGATLAKAYNAPILLTEADSLPNDTLNEIKRLGAKNVIILGGSGSVGTNVQKALKNNGLSIKVVKGESRFATAVMIAKETKNKTSKNPTEIFFVSSEKFADALSVSAIAAIKGAPIIYLPKTGSIDSVTASYLASLKGVVKKAYVIGGSGVISQEVMQSAAKALGLKADSTVIRVKGQTKYETCIAVNNKFASVLTGKAVCVATGENFPDALAGGVFAAVKQAPLFLAHGSLSSEQKSYLKTKAPDTIYVFGGKGAVPVDLVKSVAAAAV